jgi:outer membrane protein OmpA-like peptidoglycan-associated protein
MGKLGTYAKDNNLNSSGFLSLLNSQKSSIVSALPSGLNLAGALGLGSLSDIGAKLSNYLSGSSENMKDFTRQASEPVKKTATWLWPVAAGLGIVLLATYIINSGSARKVADKIQAENLIPPKVGASDITTPIKEFFKVQLPNGSTLDAYKGGVEDKLATCLSNPSCTAGKDKWFDFDELNFEMSSSTITLESQKQIKNIASIMNAYPSAKIKIGGYTDLKGEAFANKRISQERAEAVVLALQASGVKSSQITGAEGYGSEFATVPVDASDEMRARDRKISIQLNSK